MNDFTNWNRRQFLRAGTFSLAPLAIASLLQRDGLLAAPIKPGATPTPDSLKQRAPHATPKATAMISLFMQGGPSQIDMFDPKPELNKLDGQSFPGTIKYDNAAQASSKVLGCPWKFQPHGECGTELSELLPYTSRVVDDICVIRSMHTGVNNHGQSIHALNSGRIQRGRPALGSWLTYGLGNAAENLPAFMALPDPGGIPVEGVLNWSNGWLPSLFQGTVIRPQEPRIFNLEPPATRRGAVQDNYLAYLRELNARHQDEYPTNTDLQARIANYELAAQMQVAAAEALDLSKETEATQKMYGIGDKETEEYGRRCLIARRLIERGVRFVQVYTRNQFWDHHGSIRTSLPRACKLTDQPAAALVTDLKQRGLLDSTVVHWGGEMGRLPVIQNDAGPAKVGRDHNTYGFSMWVAGGGFRRGGTYGATDEFGHHAVENIVNHYDYHATLLHLFGLDPERLTFERNGRLESLLDGQPGQVVAGLLQA
ncbi:MAG: DUF1501 domain-containing protein [Planctomycetaceae bacterium]|nr:DUF1501 domain-containing protein [Planctomycetaceae bacterium]MCB9953423.1 DUF1501 domain-containing protein [Planctomycetaceae bacterium]